MRNRGGTESIKKKIAALNRAKVDLPNQLAEKAVTFFKKSFRNEGWQDQSVQRWPARKGEIGKGLGKVSKKSASSRGILIKSGHLRNSIHTVVSSWRKIRIESGLPYAAIHNYGLTGMAFGKHKFKMPKRKFMGNSYILRKEILRKIEITMKGVMRK